MKYAILLLILFTGCAAQEIDPLAGIVDRGKIIVGSDIPYPPMEFFEGDTPAGLDIDIAQEIADSLGVEMEVIDYDWDGLFMAVESGEVDFAISSITITAERSEKMLFSVPYFNAGQTIVVADSTLTLDDLKELKIGAQTDTTSYDEAEKLGIVVGFETYEEHAIPALRSGEISAIVIDYVAAAMIAKEADLEILGDPFTQEFYGIATNKENTALMDEINSLLRDMKRTGKLKELSDKWLK